MGTGVVLGKMKVAGIVLLVISIIGLITGISLAFGLPYGLWYSSALEAREYDNWLTNPDRYDGEVQTFKGEIAEKNSADIGGVTIYSYRFNGCDNGFLSSEDIGDKGDSVLIQIRIVEVVPGTMSAEVHLVPPVMLCAVPGIVVGSLFLILLIVGIILLSMGVKRDANAPKVLTEEEKKHQAMAAQMLADAQAQVKIVEERKLDYSSYGEAEYDDQGRPKLASFSSSYTGQFDRQQHPRQQAPQGPPRPTFDGADMDQFQASVRAQPAGGSSQTIETVSDQPAMVASSSGPAYDDSAPKLEFAEGSSIKIDDMAVANIIDDIEIETVNRGMTEEGGINDQLVSASGRFDNSPPSPQPGQQAPLPGQTPEQQKPQPQLGTLPQN